ASRHDPYLTDLGVLQAKKAADRLARRLPAVTEILVSPAARAQETAAPLIDATGIPAVTVEDLVEMKLPLWEGQPEEQVQRIFAESRLRPPDLWWDGIEGGESFRDFHTRIEQALTVILSARGVTPDATHPQLWRSGRRDDVVAVVAHGGTNSVAMTLLLGVEPTPWEWERFVLGHGSIARLRNIPLAGGHVWSLRSFNDQEHLEDDERSA
ncbi:MAG: histidine phosphatase family protein, partial [Acidimicrobiia bacterium]|nr:histidine phosphatase family protein [Acidimicrobiia bacterium]